MPGGHHLSNKVPSSFSVWTRGCRLSLLVEFRSDSRLLLGHLRLCNLRPTSAREAASAPSPSSPREVTRAGLGHAGCPLPHASARIQKAPVASPAPALTYRLGGLRQKEAARALCRLSPVPVLMLPRHQGSWPVNEPTRPGHGLLYACRTPSPWNSVHAQLGLENEGLSPLLTPPASPSCP